MQTLKHEVLNGFCVVSELHLDHILRLASDWYNHRRCNSAQGNLPPVRENDDPPFGFGEPENRLRQRARWAPEVVSGGGVS